jgi:N utilization substance protein B
MSRRLVRELVVQRQYQQALHPDDQGNIFEDNEAKLSDNDRAYYEMVRRGIVEHIAEIDPYIANTLKRGWSLERLSIVDRAILRLAVYEMLYQPDIPKKVVINEAVDLAKSFSGEEASRFINGILDRVMKAIHMEVE